ncbi:MAG: hypothetical protein ACLFUJ_02705 [Phycisphaerae bacterium]
MRTHAIVAVLYRSLGKTGTLLLCLAGGAVFVTLGVLKILKQSATVPDDVYSSKK